MSHYERIARIIRYVTENRLSHPSLEVIAHEANMSAGHLHALFSEWVGVTPKDFLQCLTLNHAKYLLREGHSVLDCSLRLGLSGPSRLHDLCVTLEAATPGDVKSGGAQLLIEAGFADSPFGLCLIAESSRGICHLSFVDGDGETSAWEGLRQEWPSANFIQDNKRAEQWANRIFTGNGIRKRHPLRAYVQGSPFQVRVWRALLEIPFGQLVSYGKIAERIGAPNACRAVGSAVGSNSISFLIPCHRVIRETGVVGHYRWGTTRKQAMLVWEAAASKV